MIRFFTDLDLPGLYPDELDEVNALWQQLNDRVPRNLIREQYYDSKNLFKNLGIAVPAEFEKVNWVLGWPAMAVDKLAARIRHQGFVIPGADGDPYGIEADWSANQMDLGLRQAILSSLIHSVSFVAVTEGDPALGEPAIVYSIGSALNSTGIWDARRRCLRSALFLNASDDFGAPLDVAIFLAGGTLRLVREERGTPWYISRIPHSLGRVPVEALVFRPRLERPFGTSRISRPVMSITDSALRTVARGELSAEFFSAPQRYLMGADENMFKDKDGKLISQWEAVIGRIFAAPMVEDADGNAHVPQAGQFNAQSPVAHAEMLRLLAQQFAGETSLPVASLGVSQESNPASADSINASREDLIYLGEDAGATLGASVNRLAQTGFLLREKKAVLPPRLAKLQSRWRDPATITRAAAADAGAKIISAFPWMAETKVGLELAGLDPDTVERALAEKAAAQAAIAARTPAPAPAVATPELSNDGAPAPVAA